MRQRHVSSWIAGTILTTCSCASAAVRVSEEGLGQALIFPYYTTREAGGNRFNTYLTIVNQTGDSKALRVRFREGRNSREVASFNLYLSARDVWTGALQVLPSQAAQLITSDTSCVSPAFNASTSPPNLTFTNVNYSGANADRDSTSLDRTQEGLVEVVEMGTLDAAATAAVTHNANGTPANCAYVQGAPTIAAGTPTGGLSGTLTVINVASGMDFTVNAVAIAGLFTAPFFRPPTDAYPDLNVAETDKTSMVVDGELVYLSNWSRGADAVSAVLMSKTWSAELVLDRGTRSATDVVVSYPTRQHYGGTTEAAFAPFSTSCVSASQDFRGETIQSDYFNREESATTGQTGLLTLCGSSVVFDFTSDEVSNPSVETTRVLGSRNRAQRLGAINVAAGQSGWARLTKLDNAVPLTSLATSTRINTRTGATAAGSHSYFGLPIVGFNARTFLNGTLQCSAGACQGNYGGSFPLYFTRKITVQ